MVKKFALLLLSAVVLLVAVWSVTGARNNPEPSTAAETPTDELSYAQQQVAKAKASPIDKLMSQALAPGALVEPHKDIGSCFACHTAWTSVKETGCTACHLEEQLFGSTRPSAAPSHKAALGTVTCTACHTDHQGPDANITLPFDHGVLPPKTLAACASCHSADEALHLARALEESPASADPLTSRALFEAAPALHENHAQGFGGVSCSECHTTSDWTSATYVHTKETKQSVLVASSSQAQGKSCSECHVSEVRVHESQGKYSTNCAACHSVETWKPTAYSHLRKSNALPDPAASAPAGSLAVPTGHPPGGPAGCTNCHARETPSHGPQYGTACGACHATTQWTGASRDPLSLAAVEGGNTCASCHLDKMKVHLAQPEYGADCSRCHVLTSWTKVNMDHSLVGSQACTKCHAAPQTATHPKTSSLGVSCSACHTTNAWRPASFDHASLVDRSAATCTQCHTEKVNGKHQNGRVFNAACTLCHIAQDPKGTAFNHADAAARTTCDACHSRDVPTSPSHKTFVAQCALCHSPTAWRPAKFQHQGVIGFTSQKCLNCHAAEYRAHARTFFNQTGATCQKCHNTTQWRPANFNHNAAVASPSLTCLSCHRVPANSWLHSNVAPKGCLACHTLQSWSAVGHGG